MIVLNINLFSPKVALDTLNSAFSCNRLISYLTPIENLVLINTSHIPKQPEITSSLPYAPVLILEYPSQKHTQPLIKLATIFITNFTASHRYSYPLFPQGVDLNDKTLFHLPRNLIKARKCNLYT